MHTYSIQGRWENDLILTKDVGANSEIEAIALAQAGWGNRATGLHIFRIINHAGTVERG